MENKGAKRLKNIIVVTMFCSVIVVVMAVYSFIFLNNAKKEQNNQLHTIASLTTKEDDISKSIEELNSEEYKQEYYRNELNMVEKGNQVYIYNK